MAGGAGPGAEDVPAYREEMVPRGRIELPTP